MTQTRFVIKALEQSVEKDTKRIVRSVTRELVKDTPKDTRFAASNWVPSVDTAFTGLAGTKPKKAGDPGVDFGPQQRGLAEVETTYKFGLSAFITNNVEYLPILNAGSSTQAPMAFVQRAILNGVRNATT